MNGPSFINVELTSRCNANCWCCGRRKLEREHPDLCNFGDMDINFVEEISSQISPGTVCQFHWNGEPTLYSRLGEALGLFKHCIRQFDTNGKLILEKADEIIGNLDILTISVVEREEQDEQYERVCHFLEKRGVRKPALVYRLLGNVNKAERWGRLPGVIAKRILHSPDGSRCYTKPVTVPEIGVCLDLLTHLAIDRLGDVSVCVRFDPNKQGVIGNLNYHSLDSIWNCTMRKYFIDMHLEGYRNKLFLCSKCDYWGIPRGE